MVTPRRRCHWGVRSRRSHLSKWDSGSPGPTVIAWSGRAWMRPCLGRLVKRRNKQQGCNTTHAVSSAGLRYRGKRELLPTFTAVGLVMFKETCQCNETEQLQLLCLDLCCPVLLLGSCRIRLHDLYWLMCMCDLWRPCRPVQHSFRVGGGYYISRLGRSSRPGIGEIVLANNCLLRR